MGPNVTLSRRSSVTFVRRCFSVLLHCYSTCVHFIPLKRILFLLFVKLKKWVYSDCMLPAIFCALINGCDLTLCLIHLGRAHNVLEEQICRSRANLYRFLSMKPYFMSVFMPLQPMLCRFFTNLSLVALWAKSVRPPSPGKKNSNDVLYVSAEFCKVFCFVTCLQRLWATAQQKTVKKKKKPIVSWWEN